MTIRRNDADAAPQAEVPERPAQPAEELPQGDDRHLRDQPGQDQARHDQGPDADPPPERMGPEDVGEREHRVVGPAPEHAPVGAAPADDALPRPGVGGLHGRRVPRPREPPIGPRALVEELEARDVDGAAVHQARLERRRGGRQAGRDRMELEGTLGGGASPSAGMRLRRVASRTTSWEHPQIWTTRNRRAGAAGAGGIRAHRASPSSRPTTPRPGADHQRAGLVIGSDPTVGAPAGQRSPCAAESASATVSQSWPSESPRDPSASTASGFPRRPRTSRSRRRTGPPAEASPPTSSARDPAARRPDLRGPLPRLPGTRRGPLSGGHAHHRDRRRRGRLPHRRAPVPRGARDRRHRAPPGGRAPGGGDPADPDHRGGRLVAAGARGGGRPGRRDGDRGGGRRRGQHRGLRHRAPVRRGHQDRARPRHRARRASHPGRRQGARDRPPDQSDAGRRRRDPARHQDDRGGRGGGLRRRPRPAPRRQGGRPGAARQPAPPRPPLGPGVRAVPRRRHRARRAPHRADGRHRARGRGPRLRREPPRRDPRHPGPHGPHGGGDAAGVHHRRRAHRARGGARARGRRDRRDGAGAEPRAATTSSRAS